ncbi:hypothetical protein ACKVWL_004826 [Pyricularia oryzae]
MAPGRPVYRSGDGIHGPEIEDVILGLFKLHGSDRSLQVDNSTYGRMSTWTCNCSSSVYCVLFRMAWALHDGCN